MGTQAQAEYVVVRRQRTASAVTQSPSSAHDSVAFKKPDDNGRNCLDMGSVQNNCHINDQIFMGMPDLLTAHYLYNCNLNPNFNKSQRALTVSLSDQGNARHKMNI